MLQSNNKIDYYEDDYEPQYDESDYTYTYTYVVALNAQ
jgi:hypothetical protein